jgi:hypothetical protein
MSITNLTFFSCSLILVFFGNSRINAQCDYTEVITTSVTVDWGYEMSWILYNEDGEEVGSFQGEEDNETIEEVLCLPDGCYTLLANDTYGDGWNGGFVEFDIEGEIVEYELDNGSDGAMAFGVNTEDCIVIVPGCTVPGSINFDPDATEDDGSCQAFESSLLPLIVINTNDQDIVDEPDIVADMYIIDNGTGNIHTLDDDHTYDGGINIELRGSSSQGFGKHNYAVETIDVFGEDLDTNLLGFPKEEDWVLHGPWADKSFFRNVLAMHLSNEMGRYSSRTRFCELFIDDEYLGVFVFMEKIKRDDSRVDIAKLTELDISGDELTGGYILKFDWPESDGWNSEYDAVAGNSLYIQYRVPSAEDIQPEQAEYIQAYVDSFEHALFSPDFHNEWGKRYTDYIDIYSFVDQLLISELSKDVDAYKLSTYMHKDKDSNDRRLKAGPQWDFNIAWFNSSYCAGGDHEGWLFEEADCEDLDLMPRWWERFWADDYFLNALHCRWQEVQPTLFNANYLHDFIDSYIPLLEEAADRNYDRWDILDEDTWAHPFELPGSWEGEVQLLKDWIENRLNWMSLNIPGDCSVSVPTLTLELEGYPNPASSHFTLKSSELIKTVQVFDSFGRLIVDDENISARVYTLDLGDLPVGVYSCRVSTTEATSQMKLIKE